MTLQRLFKCNIMKCKIHARMTAKFDPSRPIDTSNSIHNKHTVKKTPEDWTNIIVQQIRHCFRKFKSAAKDEHIKFPPRLPHCLRTTPFLKSHRIPYPFPSFFFYFFPEETCTSILHTNKPKIHTYNQSSQVLTTAALQL